MAVQPSTLQMPSVIADVSNLFPDTTPLGGFRSGGAEAAVAVTRFIKLQEDVRADQVRRLGHLETQVGSLTKTVELLSETLRNISAHLGVAPTSQQKPTGGVVLGGYYGGSDDMQKGTLVHESDKEEVDLLALFDAALQETNPAAIEEPEEPPASPEELADLFEKGQAWWRQRQQEQ